MRRTPSLSTIEAFLAAAECGSLKSAADRLCLSAPAVTRRIQALERQSGTPLFERRAGGVVLTAAGRELAARIGPAVDEVKAALRPAADAKSPVRLRVSRSLAGLWLAPRLARLPNDVALEFHSDLTMEGFLAGGADLGIFFDARPAAQMTAEMLITVEISVVSAPRLADGRAAPGAVSDAASFRLIGLSGQPRLWPDAASGLHASLTFDGIQAMYEAAASGLGLAPGIHPLVDPYLASGRLIELAPFGRVRGGAYTLVATRQAMRSKKVARVREWLVREASGPAPPQDSKAA